MSVNFTPLRHTPLPVRDLARSYKARERRGLQIKTVAGGLALLLLIGGSLGYLFRDSLRAARGEEVLGEKNTRTTQSGIAQPQGEPSEDSRPKRYRDEFIEFDLPDGWAARQYSSDLAPGLLRVIELFPASELPAFDTEGKLYQSKITVTIAKDSSQEDSEAPANARVSTATVDGIPAEIREQRLEADFFDTLNKPLEGINITAAFPSGTMRIVITYRFAAHETALKQRRDMFRAFLESVSLPGKSTPSTMDPQPATESNQEPKGASASARQEGASEPSAATSPPQQEEARGQSGRPEAEASSASRLREFRMRE